MNLPDTNVWLALALSEHVFHHRARKWFADQSVAESVLFCRSTQQSFLQLLTTEMVMQRYGLSIMNNAAAWQLYEEFLADSRITWVGEPRTLDARWKSFATRRTASPKLWMDAYLAAFAVAGGHRLVTTDHAFAQFKGLDLIILAKQ